MDSNDIRVPVRYLQAAGDGDDFDEDDGPWRFHGIAVGPGDVLHMEDGTPVLFTAEELMEAADSQAGEPLTADHPEDDLGRPEYPPSTEDTYGKVPKAGYIDGKGVGYEATIHDPELARGIYAGTYEVSVHPRFRAENTDEETGLLKAEDIEFLDLSVVSKGDSPSNSVNWGPSAELAAWVTDTDISRELTEALAQTQSDENAEPDQGLEVDAAGGPISYLSKVANKLGFDVDVDDDAGHVVAQHGDEPAEPGTDPSEATAAFDHMDDNTIQALVEEHGYSRESLEAMADDDVERLAETVLEEDDDGGQADNQTQASAEIPDEYDSLDEYVTAKAEEVAEARQSQSEKENLADDIIANSQEFDEDDRESLLAMDEDGLKKMRSEFATAAQLPGATGRSAALASAPGTGGDEDADQYTDLVAQMRGHDEGGDD